LCTQFCGPGLEKGFQNLIILHSDLNNFTIEGNGGLFDSNVKERDKSEKKRDPTKPKADHVLKQN
jgi:hypothetical protein